MATMAMKTVLLLAHLAVIKCFTRPLTSRLTHTVPSCKFMTVTPLESAVKDPTTPEEQLKLYDAEDAFTLLASLAATTLLQSDRRRDAIGKDIGAQASSATNWIDEGSAFRLRSVLNSLELYMPSAEGTSDRERQDEAITWLRWMRSVPRPVIVDLSLEARMAANGTVSDEFLQLLNLSTDVNGDLSSKLSTTKMQQIRNEFLNRLACKCILLPSGQSTQGSLIEPNGSLVFGKLLYGGVTRYRILPSSNARDPEAPPKPPRRAGEKTERKTSLNQHIPCWVQYGGTERRYDGVDMGPAMVLEVSLSPKIQTATDGTSTTFAANNAKNTVQINRGDMVLNRLAWNPQKMFQFANADEENKSNLKNSTNIPITSGASTLQGKERNDAFISDFKDRVGGLGPQIDAIVRRVLDGEPHVLLLLVSHIQSITNFSAYQTGRVIRPAEVDANGNLMSFQEAKSLREDDGFHLDDSSKLLSMAALEAQELEVLGLTPVRGLLLYGPPGNGKTALAREIARALKARAPKIVSAPELLDRWVGGSERLVRELFHDAEAELAACSGDATRSALHVIVIDEIDAVFRKRSSAEDSGEATRSSTVNQILAKLDGVQAIPNVLLIGMTNRRELLDEALLRPGRLEVQIEIPLPSRHGRREILQIHTDALRKKGRLSHPLCCAIDGVKSAYTKASSLDDSKPTVELGPDATRGRKRRAIKRATSTFINSISSINNAIYDLADDRWVVVFIVIYI
jgi:vesicle-fusing ATPase